MVPYVFTFWLNLADLVSNLAGFLSWAPSSMCLMFLACSPMLHNGSYRDTESWYLPSPNKDLGPKNSLQVGLYLGPYPAVVLYDYEDARDLFNQDVVSGRIFFINTQNLKVQFQDAPTVSFIDSGCLEANLGEYLQKHLGFEQARLIFNDGEDWKNQRRFILKTLKDFGFGK